MNTHVKFGDDDLEEMGVFKKGLRMQFLASLKELRSLKLICCIVKGEGMKKSSMFSWKQARKRVKVKWLEYEKITAAASGDAKKPYWNESMTFPPADLNEAIKGECVFELINNTAIVASCSVPYDEIDKVNNARTAAGGEGALGDGKPFPLINSKSGEVDGVIWIKLWLMQDI